MSTFGGGRAEEPGTRLLYLGSAAAATVATAAILLDRVPRTEPLIPPFALISRRHDADCGRPAGRYGHYRRGRPLPRRPRDTPQRCRLGLGPSGPSGLGHTPRPRPALRCSAVPCPVPGLAPQRRYSLQPGPVKQTKTRRGGAGRGEVGGEAGGVAWPAEATARPPRPSAPCTPDAPSRSFFYGEQGRARPEST